MYDEAFGLITKSLDSLEKMLKKLNPDLQEKYLELHLLRYFTKINLQTCAIKSQLDDHAGALVYAKKGLFTCFKILQKSYEVCKDEIRNDSQASPKQPSSKKKKAAGGAKKGSQSPASRKRKLVGHRRKSFEPTS